MQRRAVAGYDPRVMRLHHIALRTRDLAALAEFYTRVLALAVVGERPGYAVWLSIGDAVLMLETAAEGEPGVPAGGMDLVALSVDDAGRETVRGRLRVAGVAVEAETDWTTYFRDPDGRRVAVSTYPLEIAARMD